MKFPALAPEFPPVLRRVALILVAMMIGSLVLTVYMTRRLEFPIPFGIVWMTGDQQWCDFRAFQERSVHFRTAAYWFEYDYPMTYPAAVAVILAMIYKLPHPLKIYLTVLFAGWIDRRSDAGARLSLSGAARVEERRTGARERRGRDARIAR